MPSLNAHLIQIITGFIVDLKMTGVTRHTVKVQPLSAEFAATSGAKLVQLDTFGWPSQYRYTNRYLQETTNDASSTRAHKNAEHWRAGRYNALGRTDEPELVRLSKHNAFISMGKAR